MNQYIGVKSQQVILYYPFIYYVKIWKIITFVKMVEIFILVMMSAPLMLITMVAYFEEDFYRPFIHSQDVL
jgi:hypothetical protein